ncbi:MAG: CHAD domain-containing protein [Burkholderiales bacterium]
MKKKEIEIRAPSIARTPCLRPGMSPQQAILAVVSESLRHLQANAHGVLAGDNIEFVHQMRIALRRLRSTKKAFAGLLTDEAWQSVDEDIKWLAKLLGDARDLDVFLTQTLPPIEAALHPDADFSPLKQAVSKRRNVMRRKIRTALKSVRYRALTRRLQGWCDESPPQPAADSCRLLKFTRRSLNKRRSQVNRLAHNWQALNREQRHELRKKAKVLRYAVEFFSALYPTKAVKRYLAKLQSVQQILGELNDGVSAKRLLHELIKNNATLKPLGRQVFDWLAVEATKTEPDLGHAIKQLEKAKTFWREK